MHPITIQPIYPPDKAIATELLVTGKELPGMEDIG
jgi:hypothetical protein